MSVALPSAVTKYDLSTRAKWLFSRLNLREATGDPNAVWEAHQIQFLNSTDTLTHDTKARQIVWSWTAAADAVSKGVLEPRHTSIFVSINLDEAQEKVRYAEQIIDALAESVRPKLLADNRFEIEFENGSRIISHPARRSGAKLGLTFTSMNSRTTREIERFTLLSCR